MTSLMFDRPAPPPVRPQCPPEKMVPCLIRLMRRISSGETLLIAASDTPAPKPEPAPCEHPAVPQLSMREAQVLTGMAQGKGNAQIGRDLYLSEDTIKTHARRLFQKLGAKDRAHAVALGFRAGILS